MCVCVGIHLPFYVDCLHILQLVTHLSPRVFLLLPHFSHSRNKVHFLTLTQVKYDQSTLFAFILFILFISLHLFFAQHCAAVLYFSPNRQHQAGKLLETINLDSCAHLLKT